MQENLLRNLKASFSDALFADKFHFYKKGNPIVFRLLEYSRRHHPSQTDELDNKIFECLLNDDLESAFHTYNLFLEPIIQKKPQYHPDVVRQATAFFLNTVYLKAENMLNDNLKGNIVNDINKIQSNSTTFEDLVVRSQTVFSLIYEGLNLQRKSISKDRMSLVRRYIDGHYMADLTLDIIADKFYFNPSYLSTLFKSSFGYSFSDYLANVRINASKTLLKNPNNKVTDVAKLVGYKDSSYFARVFKKKVGLSPEEYRRMSNDG